jgi:hypothetical protein
VVVSVTKDGVKFSTTGDIGSANITCRQNTSMDKARRCALCVLPHPPPSCALLTPLRRTLRRAAGGADGD